MIRIGERAFTAQELLPKKLWTTEKIFTPSSKYDLVEINPQLTTKEVGMPHTDQGGSPYVRLAIITLVGMMVTYGAAAIIFRVAF
jgi:hypothetical protein